MLSIGNDISEKAEKASKEKSHLQCEITSTSTTASYFKLSELWRYLESSMLLYCNQRSRKSETLNNSSHERKLEDKAAEKKAKNLYKKIPIKVNP